MALRKLVFVLSVLLGCSSFAVDASAAYRYGNDHDGDIEGPAFKQLSNKSDAPDLKFLAGNWGAKIQQFLRPIPGDVDLGVSPDEQQGGGLVRSAGGWTALKALRRIGAYRKGDERMLGDSDFVKSVLAQAKEDFERKHQLQLEGISFEHLVNRVAELLGLTFEQVLARGNHKETVAARGLLCYWATTELGISQVKLSQKLKISQPAVSLAVRRGEQLAHRNRYSLKA